MLGGARSALVKHTCPIDEGSAIRDKIPPRFHISVPASIEEFSLFVNERTGKSRLKARWTTTHQSAAA